MKNYIKTALRTTVAVCVMMSTFLTTAFAGVLGTPSGGWQTDMGGGAVYSNNVFSADGGIRQTENFVEYTPNGESVPVVVNGESIYGSRTISSAATYMQKNNLRPLVGINGDYFSTKTGIPMGYTIIDGKLISKESGIQDAIGFRDDGTAFIDKLGIESTLSHKDKQIKIQYVNKWPQKGFSWVYLLDSNYGTSTQTNFNALYVICSATDGDMSLNSKMTLKVDEVFIYDGAIKIPDGKYVFVMDPDGDKTCFDLLANLAPNDELVFENTVFGSENKVWTEAKYAISSIGGRLVENGVIGSGFESGTAPRTAVGIKADGNVIFYTIDGRQSGYSKGVTLTTLAKRMLELGCVEAINLDGGGSTAIGGIFPGSDKFVVSNRPSDSRERRCANYLFLQDLREKTDIVWYVEWNEKDNHNYVSGTTYKLEALSVYDTGNYKMDELKDITFSIENGDGANATIDPTGLITFSGNGKVKVQATGERYNKTFSFEVFEKPEEIRIINQATGESVEKLEVYEGEMVNYVLEAGAYVNGIRLESNPGMFKWESSGSIATVDDNGVVSIKDDGSKSGSITASINGVTKEMPINVVKKPIFDDVNEHWARETIEKMARGGIINGFEENGKKLYKPDQSITRVQFAAIVAKSIGLDIDNSKAYELPFTDTDKIQGWAVDYVKAMVQAGYISGRSDDNGKTVYFAPESTITRAEAFTMLGRTIDAATAEEAKFSDKDKIPKWAEAEIMKLIASGFINGYEDNTIRPNKTITRAETAVLADKLTKR